jgi:hypothetical protein
MRVQSMDNRNPTVNIDPRDIYVEQTNLPDSYNLMQLTNISARDYKGKLITINKCHFLWDTTKVDYSHEGTYVVSISVMDDEANMTLDYVTVHVLSPAETERINSQSGSKEETHQKKHSFFKSNLLPKDQEQRIRYSSDLPEYNQNEDEDSHIWDKTSRMMIWGFVIVTIAVVIFFFKDMFF